MYQSEGPRILIAGASGYIGKALIPNLLEKFPTASIIALSRQQQPSTDSRVQWTPCDLFSIESLHQVVPNNLDIAFYLVHSMGPTAHLDQGSFADYDLILADNFARAVKRTSVRQVVYLGGLIPEHSALSLHLQSRLEVEETFQEHQLPTTIFRAGLILGQDGTSFQILLKLVNRLPFMLCPKWTQTLTTPVGLSQVIESLVSSAGETKFLSRVFDLAGCNPLTYLEMMKETARKLGKKRFFIKVPFLSPFLSRLWVSLVTNSPRNLVYPLIESLQHSMVAREDHLFLGSSPKNSYFEMLDNSMMQTQPGGSLFRFQAQRKTVRSVQRIAMPKNRDAEWVRIRYMNWLAEFVSPFIIVFSENQIVQFKLFRKIVLLELVYSHQLSDSGRQILKITSGILVGNGNRGWLEFRAVLHGRFVLAAIHDYKPSMPWYFYKFTQAILHIFVMRAFARDLKSN